jgi:hypothetical protein
MPIHKMKNSLKALRQTDIRVTTTRAMLSREVTTEEALTGEVPFLQCEGQHR